jgi:hypothetical protein
LEEIGADGMLMLKEVSNKEGMVVWTRFICLTEEGCAIVNTLMNLLVP